MTFTLGGERGRDTEDYWHHHNVLRNMTNSASAEVFWYVVVWRIQQSPVSYLPLYPPNKITHLT